MRIYRIFVFLLMVFLAGSVFAAGRKDNVSRAADDPSGFSDSIDISKLKPGKYNYYLEATDKAQNVTRSGPENIRNDPASDIPIATIINPIPRMSVGGNLNIVGLAFDDDGVDFVEFAVYRGADGKGQEVISAKASGKDYWSYFLETKDPEIWTDGDYTIVAWATDINGLSGIAGEYSNGTKVPAKARKTHRIVWRLDRKKPETLITSHDIGALVSGNVRMRGTVNDGNGIASLAYSTDGGVKYLPAKISQNKRSGEYDWEVNINSKTLEDGPSVIWFKATDRNGSVGVAAHLLFVNNTGPDVKIMYPEANTAVNGIFSIAGYAQHSVGIKKVTWRAGNASGEFENLPGNPWWSADIDIRNQKISALEVEIRAEDVSGNVTTARQKYRVDQVQDLPLVVLEEPVTGALASDMGIVVKGTISDDDGVSALYYSLNGGAAVELPSTGSYFQFLIPRPADGTYNLEVWAKDIHGVIGNKAAARGIAVSSAATQPGIANIVYGKRQALPFYTGMTLHAVPIVNARTGDIIGAEKAIVNLAYKAPFLPAAASIAFGDNAPIPVKLAGSKDIFTAAVPMPDDLSDGLTRIRLTATDRNGNETVFDEYAYINNQMPNEFISIALPFSFALARPKIINDGRIVLGSPDEVLYGISTKKIASVSLIGGSGLVAQVDEFGRVAINAVSEGDLGTFSLRLQLEDGSTQNTQPFRILADFNGPVITIPSSQPSWIRNSVPARFNVSSRTRVGVVEYSVDMGITWFRFPSGSSEFNQNVDISSTQDGSITVLIRATNDSGKFSIADFTVLKDTQAPKGELVMPASEARVNGTIKMAFSIEEKGLVQSIAYKRNANAAPREIYNANNMSSEYDIRFYEVIMDSVNMPLDSNMSFIFTDKAGNSSELRGWSFVIDQQMDIPVVHIILPQENEVITTDFITSGVMFDDDGIKNIQWRLNNGAWQTIEAANGFSVPVFLNSLTDNEHTITVIAEDIYGVRSQPETRRFRVSLSEPAATVLYPLYDTVLKDLVEIRGTAFDRNGIQRAAVSVDNGNTFNNVMGNFGTTAETVQWNYRFNTKILKDGAHVMFIRVWDRYDVPATYACMINVDNTFPDIVLDNPHDGAITANTISVMGRIEDDNLQEINIQVRSLEGVTIIPTLRNRRLDPIVALKESFDLAGQADGHYNMAVIATDKAGNVSRVSRNFEIARQTQRNYVEILYPLENEETAGEFMLYGFAGGSDAAGSATVRINGKDSNISEVDDNGFFSFKLNSEDLNDGNNAVVVHSNFGGSTMIQSRAYNIIYRKGGPWVTIDSFNFGDFAYDRPYLTGKTGYQLSDEDKEILADRSADKNLKAEIQRKTLSHTEISFDNGRTFIKTQKSAKRDVDYRYRIETYDMKEGNHYIIVRSTMKNGEIAVTRMLVQVDKTNPVIRLISPEAGSRYNNEIAYSASATDDVELESLTYHLRKGDKSLYEVPGFLQGLYFEATIPPFVRQIAPDHIPSFFAGGATYMDVGMGLSFFDDNVKIQVQYGFMTQSLFESLGGEKQQEGGEKTVRYGGHVLGIKLLANVYTLPFITLWGPDFEWLYASLALGANFSLFDLAKQGYTQSGSSTWMSALLMQIEFPKVSIPKRKNFRTFSLFTEGQLWFVPTDVDAKKNDIPVVIPHVIMGLRLYIF